MKSSASRTSSIAALSAGLLIAFGLATAPNRSAARQRPAPVPVCGALTQVPDDTRLRLERFVRRLGIRRVRATVGTLWTVHRTGRLPRCYLTKYEARRRGWRPGRSVWRAFRGASIGGDRFGNRERRLPRRYRYVEADLDYVGGRRGARRLVFARSTRGRWRMWITMDHYRSFRRVPALTGR